MLTVARDAADTFSVTRCDFADLAELPTGRHTSGRNKRHLDSKLEQLAHISRGFDTESWYGGLHSLTEAESLMNDGWKDGAAKAAQLAPRLSNIIPPAKPIRRRVKWDETGTELSIDRALAGDWDRAYRSLGPASMQPRVLSLGCNFGGMSTVTHAQLFWCAAQMIVLAEILENAGYAVELRALKCNWLHTDKHVLLDITVKQMHQPLRADAIAAVFGHAGSYRTFGHMLLMTSPYDIGDGYGWPGDVGPTFRRAVLAGLEDPADYLVEHAYDMATAAQNITRALTTLTGAPAQ